MNDRPFAQALRLRLRLNDEANRRASPERASRRHVRHDMWYGCVIVAPSRPGDIAIVMEAWPVVTVAQQSGGVRGKAKLAPVRIGGSNDVLSG